jgi:hypothetical protein
MITMFRNFSTQPFICRSIRARCMNAGFALALLCALASFAFAAPDDPRYRAGLRNSDGERRLSARQLQKTLDSLRHKTGFLEMRFDEAGFLTLGDRMRIAGGSASARDLLIAAVDGDKLFELESHNHSPHVTFANLTLQVIYTNEVLAAFDLGFAVLHKLAHGVWLLRDEAGDETALGDCERSINHTRRELGLPERQRYRPRIWWIVTPDRGTIALAALPFIRERWETGRAVTQRFHLQWDALRVALFNRCRPGAARLLSTRNFYPLHCPFKQPF